MIVVNRLPEDLEMFLNMPETLYVLRMNADGTDVAIEEHQILPYPEFSRLLQQLMHVERPVKAGDIRSWGFGELMKEMDYQYDMGSSSPLGKPGDDDEVTLAVQYDLKVDTLKSRVIAKRIELTLKDAGKKRILDYSLRKEHIERTMNDSKKALQEYTENLNKAWWLLQEYVRVVEGQKESADKYENIRQERCLNNLDEWCSTYVMLYLFEKPFMKLVYRLGNRMRIDPIMTVYDIPCWEFNFMNGKLSVRRKNELLRDEKSFDEWMQKVFNEPEDAVTQRVFINELSEMKLGCSIKADEVIYDPASECYILKEETEARILGELMPQKAGNVDKIAKYTTFETLVAILKSGKMRMNSLVSMNDKTETDFLDEMLKSYKEKYEQDYDKYLFADKEFITSFTTRIDDLDMWRFYGDNARGVCMVFKRDTKKNDRLYKINYIDPDKELKKVMGFMRSLKAKRIRFRLNLLKNYRHFLKHVDYNTEEEYRLIVKSGKPDGWFINHENEILTPYVELELKKIGKSEVGYYPFELKEVIIGPAMKEKIANLMQTFYCGHDCGYSLKVSESKIRSYR